MTKPPRAYAQRVNRYGIVFPRGPAVVYYDAELEEYVDITGVFTFSQFGEVYRDGSVEYLSEDIQNAQAWSNGVKAGFEVIRSVIGV